MNFKNVLSASLLFIIVISNKATAVDFTLGGGIPFLVVPEVSLASEDEKQRWFINYKMGLDDGFSFGVEHGLGLDNKHAVGVLVGALGVKNNDDVCKDEKSDDIAENLGNAISCGLLIIFSEETTNGLGLSYSYNFNGLNQSGMRLRFELGYGEGSTSHEKRIDGGFVISYQF